MKTFKSIIPGLAMIAFGFIAIAMTNSPAVDHHQPQEIQMHQELTLSGTVVDSTNGTPLAKVEVDIKRLEEPLVTNKDGEFVVEDITQGETYTLIVEHEGYEPYERTVEAVVMESSVIEVTIPLTPSS